MHNAVVAKITAQIEKQKSVLEEIQRKILHLKKKYNANNPYFEELPTSLDEVNDIKNELLARLECMEEIDPEVIREHESKDLEVKELTEKIKTLDNSVENGESEIKRIYDKWFPIVNNVIDAINKSFSEFMAEMKYVGEVILYKVDDYDFEKYGIQINVQFRKNVPLQVLDKYVQSGGERAVATATYTLALQQLTHVPFRCVDEINQGMDSTNERKIFNMIVNETTAPNKPQFFLVTPKLLPNLPCNERMAIHVIFNGSVNADCFS
ncbi:structural maintenance of chromosomes protein 5-like [Teleopsis dalmanni]|uniref:structural maintenance of chromosomes protein 5-like n=1 Tax=Teleopsis dalmanni TaxID=139649 RepID=UPI0018CEA7AF|nr:structural maintenance of chromosomes protein 5-like [Teleopsis dalmanni]